MVEPELPALPAEVALLGIRLDVPEAELRRALAADGERALVRALRSRDGEPVDPTWQRQCRSNAAEPWHTQDYYGPGTRPGVYLARRGEDDRVDGVALCPRCREQRRGRAL